MGKLSGGQTQRTWYVEQKAESAALGVTNVYREILG
jgi:hypothetical protein